MIDKNAIKCFKKLWQSIEKQTNIRYSILEQILFVNLLLKKLKYDRIW